MKPCITGARRNFPPVPRRLRILFILAVFLAAVLISSAPAEIPGISGLPVVRTEVSSVSPDGSLVLSISGSGLLSRGYEYGDLLTAALLGRELTVPVAADPGPVAAGNPFCLVPADPAGRDEVLLAVHPGRLADTLRISDTSLPVPVTISLREKGGFPRARREQRLVRSNQRSDYPHLTDEQYANFRNIATTGMGEKTLYRSSSPLNPRLSRNREADEALHSAGIRTILNLADTEEGMRTYAGYSASFYSRCSVIALDMGTDYTKRTFRSKLKKGLTYLSKHEGPYLIHCTEGKDRCGFVSALLECLMGASADEVASDYMVSYYNYYGVVYGTGQYDSIARSHIEKSLASAFGVADIRRVNLPECAENYLQSIGLSRRTIAALKRNLSRSWAD